MPKLLYLFKEADYLYNQKQVGYNAELLGI